MSNETFDFSRPKTAGLSYRRALAVLLFVLPASLLAVQFSRAEAATCDGSDANLVDLYTPTFSNPTEIDNPLFPVSGVRFSIWGPSKAILCDLKPPSCPGPRPLPSMVSGLRRQSFNTWPTRT